MVNVPHRKPTKAELLAKMDARPVKVCLCAAQAASIASLRCMIPAHKLPQHVCPKCLTCEYTLHTCCRACHSRQAIAGHATEKWIYSNWFLCTSASYTECTYYGVGPNISMIQCTGCRKMCCTTKGFPVAVDETELLSSSQDEVVWLL